MVSETRTRRVAHCVPRQVNYTTYTYVTRCVPREICVTQTRCVPKTVCRQVPVTVCVADPCAQPAARTAARCGQ